MTLALSRVFRALVHCNIKPDIKSPQYAHLEHVRLAILFTVTCTNLNVYKNRQVFGVPVCVTFPRTEMLQVHEVSLFLSHLPLRRETVSVLIGETPAPRPLLHLQHC